MIIDLKFAVGQKVCWKGLKCLIVGIYIYQDGTYDYHMKIIGKEKTGIYKVKENAIESENE